MNEETSVAMATIGNNHSGTVPKWLLPGQGPISLMPAFFLILTYMHRASRNPRPKG